MKADGGSVDAHVREHDVGIPQAARQLQVGRQAEGRVEEKVVHLPVPLPKLAVQVVVAVVAVWPVQVDEVPPEQAGHEDDAAKGRQLLRARRVHGIRERRRLLRPAQLERLVRRGQVGQDILFVDHHRPPGADAGETVEAETHPEGPPPLLFLSPIPGRW